jgi:hypothetical protein
MAEKNPFRFLLFETENDAVIILNHAKKVGLIATPTYLNRRTGPDNTEITEAEKETLQGIRIDDYESAEIIFSLVENLNMKVQAYGDAE